MTTPTVIRHTKTGSFDPSEHMEFVKNRGRNYAFKKAFERYAPGKVVMDIGTGSGILAIYALRAGAKRVIAVEKDVQMVDIARENFERHGFLGRIEVIIGDALSLTRVPPADVICGELLSTWSVSEFQVPVLRHVLNRLANDPIVIPKRLIDSVQGVEAIFGDSEGLVRIHRPYFEFNNTEKAIVFTDKVVVFDRKLHRDMSTEVQLCIALKIKRTGNINALRLTSIAETVEGVFVPQSDDTNPAVIVPLPESIRVERDQRIRLTVDYVCGGGWNRFNVGAKRERHA